MKAPKFTLSDGGAPDEAAFEAAIAAMPDDAPAVEAAPARPWRLVDAETPRDGMIVEVKFDPDHADDRAVDAAWRTTRIRATPPARGWAITAFWCNPVTREKLPAEPFCWRIKDGYALPGLLTGQM